MRQIMYQTGTPFWIGQKEINFEDIKNLHL